MSDTDPMPDAAEPTPPQPPVHPISQPHLWVDTGQVRAGDTLSMPVWTKIRVLLLGDPPLVALAVTLEGREANWVLPMSCDQANLLRAALNFRLLQAQVMMTEATGEDDDDAR